MGSRGSWTVYLVSNERLFFWLQTGARGFTLALTVFEKNQVKVPCASFSAGLRVGRLSTYPYETCDFSKTVWTRVMWLQQAIVIWITFNLTPNIPCYYLWNRRKMGISFSRAFIPRSSLMSAARFPTAPHTLTKVVISRKRLELGLYNFTNLESE